MENIFSNYLAFIMNSEVTLEKDLISAMNMGKVLALVTAHVIINFYTLEKDLMSTVSVGKLLPIIVFVIVIREFTV